MTAHDGFILKWFIFWPLGLSNDKKVTIKVHALSASLTWLKSDFKQTFTYPVDSYTYEKSCTPITQHPLNNGPHADKSIDHSCRWQREYLHQMDNKHSWHVSQPRNKREKAHQFAAKRIYPEKSVMKNTSRNQFHVMSVH